MSNIKQQNGNVKSREEIYNELLDVSTTIAGKAFKECIDLVDSEFGDKYAIKNPQLLSAILDFQQKTYVQVTNSYFRELTQQ